VTILNGSKTIGVGIVIGGVASLSTSSLGLGSHSLTARYVGTFNFMASTSGAVADVVLEKTKTTLSSSSNLAVYGSVVTFTATVMPLISGAPGGNVQFFSGTTSLGIVGLSGRSASLSTTALAEGRDSITAVYLGSTTYATSTSRALSEKIRAATTTNISSSLSPSAYGRSDSR
jgi:trimeric autotransporter adhesin